MSAPSETEAVLPHRRTGLPASRKTKKSGVAGDKLLTRRLQRMMSAKASPSVARLRLSIRPWRIGEWRANHPLALSLPQLPPVAVLAWVLPGNHGTEDGAALVRVRRFLVRSRQVVRSASGCSRKTKRITYLVQAALTMAKVASQAARVLRRKTRQACQYLVECRLRPKRLGRCFKRPARRRQHRLRRRRSTSRHLLSRRLSHRSTFLL